MMPNSISISIPGTSPKLQTSFPIDSRFDTTILLNKSVEFKLRRAYLKCWSKYYERQLHTSIQVFQIPRQFDAEKFNKIMSTFYGHTQKVDLNDLPEIMAITNFLQIQQLSSNIRDHLMAYHDQFDTLSLYQLSVRSKDEQLRQFLLSILLNKNFDDIIKRKDEILSFDLEVFKPLAEYVGKNIKRQATINWKLFNSFLKEYAKQDNELYSSLRGQFVDDQNLSSEQYSLIYLNDSKLPPPFPKNNKNFNLSQIIQNKSVFFESQILSDFNKALQKYSKNNERIMKLEERVKKIEQKNQSFDELYGKTNSNINEMMSEFQRLNTVYSTLEESSSKPFLDLDESDHRKEIRVDQSKASALYHSYSGISDKISSEEPLTFFPKPETVEESQIHLLQKFLGFDSISRGILKLIYKAEENDTRQKFLEAIHGKQDLVFLIYIFEDSKNIGVYTSTKINTKQSTNSDSQAFIFSLSENVKFRSKDESSSIKFSQECLISFSEDLQLSTNVLKKMSRCKWPKTYEGSGVKDAKWLVGNNEFYVTKFQVYEILRIDIKLDMDMDL